MIFTFQLLFYHADCFFPWQSHRFVSLELIICNVMLADFKQEWCLIASHSLILSLFLSSFISFLFLLLLSLMWKMGLLCKPLKFRGSTMACGLKRLHCSVLNWAHYWAWVLCCFGVFSLALQAEKKVRFDTIPVPLRNHSLDLKKSSVPPQTSCQVRELVMSSAWDKSTWCLVVARGGKFWEIQTHQYEPHLREWNCYVLIKISLNCKAIQGYKDVAVSFYFCPRASWTVSAVWLYDFTLVNCWRFQEHVPVLFHSRSPDHEWLLGAAVHFQIYSRLVEKVTLYGSVRHTERGFFPDRGYTKNNRSPKSVFICMCCFLHNGTLLWLKEYRTNYFTRMICPCTVSPVNWTQIGFPLPSVMHVSFFPLFQVETNGGENIPRFPFPQLLFLPWPILRHCCSLGHGL